MPAASRLPVPSPDARDRLLETASNLFARRGYQAIGLRDLASHLGLHPGSLYHHIESKQGLLFELIESSLTDLLYETRQSLKASRTTNDRLRCFVQAFIAFSQSHPDRLVLLIREAMNLTDEQALQVEHLKAVYCSLLAEIIMADCNLRGPASGPRAQTIAQAVLSLLCGYAHWSNVKVANEQLVAFVQGIVRSGRTQ